MKHSLYLHSNDQRLASSKSKRQVRGFLSGLSLLFMVSNKTLKAKNTNELESKPEINDIQVESELEGRSSERPIKERKKIESIIKFTSN